MLQICPISLSTFLTKIVQKGLRLQCQAFFLKKRHWDCSPRPFSWFLWVSKLFFAYLAKKKTLKRRNVKHIKLVLSKNR